MNKTEQSTANENERTELLNHLSALCSRSEKCRYDIRILLHRRGIGESDTDRILQQLMESGYLNEERYANAFVNDKIMLERWGRIKVAHSLRQKGIAESHIRAALDGLEMDKYRNMIRDELTKKRRTLKGDPRGLDAQLIRFGASRGYEMEFIMPLVHHPGETD